ncbi:MAG: filamentous hemagglutinin N-terminal domain-containing protein [Pleurocapsa sp.]
MAITRNFLHNAASDQKTNGGLGKRERNLTLAKLAAWCGFFVSVTAWHTLNCGSLQAQITSDGTVDTRIDTVNNVTEITGGARANSNLFHSFAEFSLATGQTAFFNHSLEIGNIISRVTGGNISNIDGLIKANGNANLILINPSGINFGANARLDIGGSFLGTTAESLIFADGTVFSATDTQVEPMLTISVPLGLQLGQNSGAINVSGEGHNLTVADPLFSPITFGESSGLRVKAGGTLALVGRDVTVDGGTIAAPGGRIELGSIAEGIVDLDFNNSNLSLGYENITAEEDIQLRSQALIDASGTTSIPGGTIQVKGKQLSLNDGSLLLVQNLAKEAAGAIEVNASESVTVSSTNDDATIRSSLTNETVGSGAGGDIKITTGRLTVDQGATIVAKTLAPGNATGGNIKIDATESVEVIGASSLNPGVTSSIVAASFGAGDAGNNSLTTDFLSASAGGTIAATAFQTGNGGDLNISAREIEITGIEPNVFAPSALTASTLGAGNAGNLTIDTSKLTILTGGRVDASTAATGNAGNIAIAATDSITIDGTVPNSVNPSLIIASGNILDPSLQQLLQLPATPSGNSGNVNITTSQLQITAGGQLTVRNDGTGNSGNLEVAADNIFVTSGGGITAASQVGRGGNINLQVADNLSLIGSSQIANDNFGAQTGGAIAIETDRLQISDRSFITTTTFAAGDGGNIDILANNIEITGTGFTEFQENFQLAALSGTLQAGTRGTGIFIGTAATGTAGNLIIDTESLNLSEGAIIFSPVFTAGTGGDLNITATDINLNASALQIGAGVGSLESGSAGDINLETERLRVNDGGTVINLTFGNAAGGDIKITASDFIELRDSPLESIVLTGIYTNTSVGLGSGGDININTGNLTIEDAVIASNTGALLPDGSILSVGGLGGNINIQADETIEVGGIPANLAFLSSGMGTTTYSASAAGDLTISTGKLIVRDGADFSTATLGAGEGGKLTVNATDSVELIGTTTIGGMNRGGLLATSGRSEFPNLEVTGASGDIKINTSQLTVRDGAKVDVQSLGMGNAGNLDVTADSILLANKGSFSAATQSGIGGNIILNGGNIVWRGESTTTATSAGEGNGGNIIIDADNLVALENSRLTADADRGRGGNIQIDTQGLFICGECQISASSQLGVDGVINIQTIQPETQLAAVDLPQQPTQPEETVALACSTKRQDNNSELTIIGRGGLPPRPQDPLSSESMVNFDTTVTPAAETPVASNKTTQLPTPARSWYLDNRGQVVLTANSGETVPHNSALPAANCHVR